ncbi:Golgi matrix protein [Rutstroemia sp. NJR-2017a WRK4]|nr:Golgi matrix protein [Rutstroemia sp. NJR-2017a WRK4]
MSAVAPQDPSNTTSSAPKKKNNNKKKKHAKSKTNGEIPNASEHEKDLTVEVADEEDGEVEESAPSTQHTPKDAHFPENLDSQTNGYEKDSSSNGHAVAPTNTRGDVEGSISNASDTTDASIRLEAMSAEREALRAEVERLRKSLVDLQEKHAEANSSSNGQDSEKLASIEERHKEEIATIKSQHEEEISTARTELEESESAKEHWESQYHALLGRVNTIKSSLGERLKADKQELAEANEKIDELESQNEALQTTVQTLEEEASKLRNELGESSKELSSLRNRHNLSQQNWVHERDDLVQQTRQLKEEADAAKEAMGDWEVLAMEERSIRENLESRVSEMEEQLSTQKEAYEAAVTERDSQSQAVDGLQRALQEIQETRRRELREMVETSEEQLQALKKLVQDSDSRCADAEASKQALQTELDRLLPFEKEVKEKNLLIGKLRHEAIVLNDHLTKALRFLKKAKPEDSIDRQLVTNHFLHFLALDRSDPKKFQILQIIASLLNWTEEQKEQAGLARPGASSNSLRLPVSPFHRTPSTPTLSTEFFTESSGNKESLADLWTGFLERSAEEGAGNDSRSGSVSSSVARPDTRSGSTA